MTQDILWDTFRSTHSEQGMNDSVEERVIHDTFRSVHSESELHDSVEVITRSNIQCENPSFKPTVFFRALRSEDCNIYAARADWFKNRYAIKGFINAAWFGSDVWPAEVCPQSPFVPGDRYRHYRGAEYQLLGVAIDVEDRSVLQVLYIAEDSTLYSRPAHEFEKNFTLICD